MREKPLGAEGLIFNMKGNKMEKIIFFIGLIGLANVSYANCYNINDPDMKNKCLALEKHSTSYCYNIKDNDMKNYCLAQLKVSKTYCYNIKSSDKKNECLNFIK